MTEPPHEDNRARPPGERQPVAPALAPWWRTRALGGVLVGCLLAGSVIAAFYLERKPRFDITFAVEHIGKQIEAKRRSKWLQVFRAACESYDCACAKSAASIGLDVEAADAVLDLVKSAATCSPADFDGLRAEALVRKGEEAAGLEQAAKVLARSPADPHAQYARALSSLRARRISEALALAESSQRARRGWSATVLVGLVLYQSGEFERARQTFSALLKDDPDDVEAHFNLALIAQQEGRYGEARTGYLKTTRLRPGHADARHNLAILTHSVGAIEEAQHHFELFRQSSPDDPRIEALRLKLAEAPPNGPALSQTAGQGAPSAAPHTR